MWLSLFSTIWKYAGSIFRPRMIREWRKRGRQIKKEGPLKEKSGGSNYCCQDYGNRRERKPLSFVSKGQTQAGASLAGSQYLTVHNFEFCFVFSWWGRERHKQNNLQN